MCCRAEGVLLWFIVLTLCHGSALMMHHVVLWSATSKPASQQASNHFSFLFWPLLCLITPGSTIL